MKFGLLFVICIISLICAVQANNTNQVINNIASTSNKNAVEQQRKMRQETDKKELNAFLNGKNLLKTVIKLLFGNVEETTATSRHVLSALVRVIDMLKNSFTQKARNSNTGFKAVVDDASVAALTMVKGVVKSVLNPDPLCAQRYMCEASSQIIREGREMAYLVAHAGAYASSYLLENQKGPQFNKSWEAARRGRSGDDCAKIYQCSHTEL
jgi:hypothetical protein